MKMSMYYPLQKIVKNIYIHSLLQVQLKKLGFRHEEYKAEKEAPSLLPILPLLEPSAYMIYLLI